MLINPIDSTKPMTTHKSRYSPASDLIPGDEFYWKTTDLRGNGLRYYVVTHIVDGIAYAYQEYHPAIVLPIDMTQEVRITGRNRIGALREYDKIKIELAQYKEREKHCATLDQAEKLALAYAMQQIGDAVGLNGLSSSPAQIVAEVKNLQANSQAQPPQVV